MDEPPQEGLDPKLAALTDLAAAGDDNILPLNDDDDYIVEESSRWLPITHHGDNQPPQVGQDPKLMECVNVGIDVMTDHTTTTTAAAAAATAYQEMDSFIPQHITQHADTAHDFVQQSIEPNYNTTNDYLPEEFVTTQTSVKEEEVNINTSTTSTNCNSKTTAKTNMNVNPKLTNKESLAEWNRIHDPTFAKDTIGRQYDFYQKQQNKKLSTYTLATPGDDDDDFPIDELMKSSCNNEANSELANAIDSVSKSTPKTRSNFWTRHEEERFLTGLQMYGWGQWKRIQTIVETRTNKQIKSHAQKRAKVYPGLKLKYSKGRPPSTKGRISSKVLAEDARIRAEARMPPVLPPTTANQYLQSDSTRMPPPDNDSPPYSSSAIPLSTENALPRRVYARSASDNSEMCTWSLACISSKEGDVANPSVTTICVKYDNGFEDNVPLECIINQDFYEQLIRELENAFALPQSSSTPPPLVDAGTPVYCQWIDPHMPNMHARWLPGTAMSQKETTYEILLDNGQRREDVPHQYVLSRPDYEERLKCKQNEPQLGRSRSTEEIYNYFNGSAVRAKCGQLSGEKRAADIDDIEPQKRQAAAAM